MKKTILVLFGLLFFAPFGWSETMRNSGNWDDATKWQSSAIADNVNKSATIDNNTDATVRSGYTYTVGNTTLSNNNKLIVGGILNIGDASNARTLTTNNNADITVTGTLIIWGDVIVNNSINFTISGTVIIKGSLIMANNANITVSGKLVIDKDFIGSNNTNANVNSPGLVTVGGKVEVGGGGSNLNTCAGCFQVAGPCTPVGGNFCNKATTILPITLLSFDVRPDDNKVQVSWSTATEENNDYFVIEKSRDGYNFTPVDSIAGAGNSSVRLDYHATDYRPFAGVSYYRLKQIDYDKRYAYSQMRRVEIANLSKGVAVYPNPNASQTLDVLASDLYNFTNVEVISLTGVPVCSATVDSYRIQLPTIGRGVYFLRLHDSATGKVAMVKYVQE